MHQETPIILNVLSAIIFFSVCGIVIIKVRKTLKKRTENQKKLQEKIKSMTQEQRSQYYQDEANKAIIRMSKYWQGR